MPYIPRSLRDRRHVSGGDFRGRRFQAFRSDLLHRRSRFAPFSRGRVGKLPKTVYRPNSQRCHFPRNPEPYDKPREPLNDGSLGADFDLGAVDLYGVQQEGLRITVENKGNDVSVADPSFYDEIQRHIISETVDEPKGTFHDEMQYEAISDSDESDSFVHPKRSTSKVRQSSTALTGAANKAYTDGSGISDGEKHKLKSLDRLCHSKSRSPSHVVKRRSNTGERRTSSSRHHSPGRSDHRDSKVRSQGPAFRKHRHPSEEHRLSSSKRNRSRQRSRSRERVQKNCRNHSPTYSRENSVTEKEKHRRGGSASNSGDSEPPWIKDPSKAISVEEIEKYLETKLKQAELQSQTSSRSVSDNIKPETQSNYLTSSQEPITAPPDFRQPYNWCTAASLSGPVEHHQVTKNESPFNLYEDLPEQPQLSAPPDTTIKKPVKSILKKTTVAESKSKENKPSDVKDSTTTPEVCDASENKPEYLVPGMATTLDLEDEDKFLYGSSGALAPVVAQHDDDYPANDSQSDPVFTGSYSNKDPGWEVVSAKSCPTSAIEDSPPEEVKKVDDVQIDPTIQSILKSIGFNFELSKLMQEKAQKEQQKTDGTKSCRNQQGSVFLGGDQVSANIKLNARSLEKARAKKARDSRKGNSEVKESYEERARRYREEQMKLYQTSAVSDVIHSESPFGSIDDSSKHSQESYSSQPRDTGLEHEVIKHRQADRISSLGENYERVLYFKEHNSRISQEVFREGGKESRCGMREVHKVSCSDEEPIDNHAGHLSGLQQLQNEYCLREGHRMLGDDDDVRREMVVRREPHGRDRKSFESETCEHSDTWPKRRKFNSCRQDEELDHDRSSRRIVIKKTEGRTRSISSQQRSSHDGHDKHRMHNDMCGSNKFVHSKNDRAPRPKHEGSQAKEARSELCHSRRSGHDHMASDVLAMNTEEKEDLMRELEKWQNRLNMLEQELSKLKKEENELMRRQQRQNKSDAEGILSNNIDMQEDIRQQMILFCRAAEINAKLLLSGKQNDDRDDVEYFKWIKGKVETKGDSSTKERFHSSSQNVTSDKTTSSEKVHAKSSQKNITDPDQSEKEYCSLKINEKKDDFSDEKVKKKRKVVHYEYFDPGDHWCRECNHISSTCQEFFEHLHSPSHIKKLDPHDRPWLPESLKNPRKASVKTKSIAVPLKGVQFMVPAQAFYCILCKEFAGDMTCAEDHLKSQLHSDNYQNFIDDNQCYEKKYNLDKATILLKGSISENNTKVTYCEKQKFTFDNQKAKKCEKDDKKEDDTKNIVSKKVKKESTVTNFKWKGKMPLIGKSPGYKKASAAAAGPDTKKVFFKVKSRMLTLSKSQAPSSQNDNLSAQDSGYFVKKEIEEKESNDSDMCVESSTDQGKIREIALPPMPKLDSCHGEVEEPAISEHAKILQIDQPPTEVTGDKCSSHSGTVKDVPSNEDERVNLEACETTNFVPERPFVVSSAAVRLEDSVKDEK